ncbi:MAG: hypothetical protein CL532_00955 [Aestuariivita sp.]|nr:hypothetical protein [Aestuariivita sp.]
MLQDDIFKRLIGYKALMLVLIIIWGGTVQMSNAENLGSSNLTNLGGLLFLIFSVVYFFVCYQLYSFKSLGKRLFAPLVLLFIFLGFLSEIVNPMDVNKNLFYLFIFYIVSPLFFVAQGIVAAMLYFSNVSQSFDSE